MFRDKVILTGEIVADTGQLKFVFGIEIGPATCDIFPCPNDLWYSGSRIANGKPSFSL